jgi:signal transduction histidine kinase
VWRELLRAAPVPLLAVDPDGVVRLASDPARRLLDGPVEGQPVDAVLPPDMCTSMSKVDGWRLVMLEGMLLDLIRYEERERARIAAGVHDDSLQVLTAAMLRLQQLRNRVSDPGALTLLDRVEESLSLAADRLRRLIFEFHPPALERSGLAAALRDTLSRMRDDFGLTVVFKDELRADPPPPTRVLLFRIAQEALSNVGQHARASSVRVTLSEQDGGYLVRIQDDGVGSARPKPGHLGLLLMRERAEFAGGWFAIDGKPGTTVTVWVPAGAGLDTRWSG